MFDQYMDFLLDIFLKIWGLYTSLTIEIANYDVSLAWLMWGMMFTEEILDILLDSDLSVWDGATNRRYEDTLDD